MCLALFSEETPCGWILVTTTSHKRPLSLCILGGRFWRFNCILITKEAYFRELSTLTRIFTEYWGTGGKPRIWDFRPRTFLCDCYDHSDLSNHIETSLKAVTPEGSEKKKGLPWRRGKGSYSSVCSILK